MGWIKRGLVFQPQRPSDLFAHAQVPTVLPLGEILRIYYADRDRRGKSYIASIDVSTKNPQKIVDAREGPLMVAGDPGTFDDDGMMPSAAVRAGDRIFLYYTGWNQGVTVPYRNSIGLAVSDDGGVSFRRMYQGPIMDRTAEEPYLAVTPCVLREDERWRMWYVSGLSWTNVDNRLEPVYVIKDAFSEDGIRWDRPNRLCIEQRHELEAFSRPWVVRTGDSYAMWFSARDSRDYRNGAGAYRIGYATSEDGTNWKRDDAAGGLVVSADGWDAKMTCYPCVVRTVDALLLFYNGNGFGSSGFGYAEWKSR